MPLVTFQPSDDHGEIVVDRPLQNLFSGDLLTDSRRAVDDAASCDVRAALVRAEGDDSSAGVDIDVFIAKASSSRPAFALSLANGPTLAHTATNAFSTPGGPAAWPQPSA